MGRKHIHTTLSGKHSRILEDFSDEYGTKNNVIERALEVLRRADALERKLPEEAFRDLLGPGGPDISGFKESLAAEIGSGESEFLESIFGGGYFVLSDETLDAILRYERGEITEEEGEAAFVSDAQRVAAIYALSTDDSRGEDWEGFMAAVGALETVNVLDVVKVSEEKATVVTSLKHLDGYPEFVTPWVETFFDEIDCPARMNSLGDLFVLGQRGSTRYDRFVDAWSREPEEARERPMGIHDPADL